MEVVGAKVVVLILLGLIKLGSGLLPLLLDKVLQRKKVSLSFFPVYPYCLFYIEGFGILLPKLLWPTVRKKIVLVIKKNLLKFEAESRKFAKFLRSLEQSIRTVKGQRNVW